MVETVQSLNDQSSIPILCEHCVTKWFLTGDQLNQMLLGIRPMFKCTCGRVLQWNSDGTLNFEGK